MTVKKLKDLLSECDEDTEILISSDGEGNNFSKLCDIGSYYYVNYRYGYTIYNDENEVKEDGYENEAKPCLVFWP